MGEYKGKGGPEGVELLRQAHACLREVVATVPEEAWGGPTPCSEWTVRQVLNHTRIDQQAYGLALTAGRPGEDPFQPADALYGDAVAELDKVLDAVADAYAGLPADAGSVPTPLGPLPLPLAAGAGALDAAVHAWDIAAATGQNRPITPALAAALRPTADQLVPRLRGYGVFAPALTSDEPRDETAALLAFLGRDPKWARPVS
ncbi:TIGR03086 family metal-binding protein [Streptomyces barringtoniae]|uniref:TIGR03086 family metal-binding protein n=1 Tax=Streptomyces barringtoniae TaxID=2892029 RepID=UPI001E64C7C7|nr:TIGR03086 family metal-binding protein [Streptomyces barringtoniae]MCC5479226.1 TIGR03086 family protein [Streptomyces barringtoniae]